MTTAAKTPSSTTKHAGLARLRDPFEVNEMGLLPKVIDKASTKGQCRVGTNASADGKYCGGYHQRSIHLDFVGHAAITKRLLEVDEDWGWEPLARNPETGMPLLDTFGGLWIRLNVLGKSKLGYGDAQGKAMDSNAMKEIIGDALRNAGMRFGMALELWHKGDLYANETDQGKLDPEQVTAPSTAAKPPAKTAVPAEGDGTPAVMLKEDWLAKGYKAKTADEALEVWRNAKRGGAGKDILAAISDYGTELRDREEAMAAPAQDPAVEATDEASEQMKEVFGGDPR